MRNLQEEKENLAGKYLTLALGDERYGVGILKVQEIIRLPEITRVPGCPDYMRGVVNLRGRIIPVIELRLRLGLSPVEYDEKTCIVVLNLATASQVVSVGIIVDTVIEVVDYDEGSIAPPPEGLRTDQYIVGIGKKENSPLCILIDIDQLLDVGDLREMLSKEMGI